MATTRATGRATLGRGTTRRCDHRWWSVNGCGPDPGRGRGPRWKRGGVVMDSRPTDGKGVVALPFGKYRDVPLGQVPLSYLQWAAGNLKLSSGLRAAVGDEL